MSGTKRDRVSQHDKQLISLAKVWHGWSQSPPCMHVSSLWFSVCTQFRDRLRSLRNFRPAFIDGTTNVRVSTVKDHAATDMLARAKPTIDWRMRTLWSQGLCLKVYGCCDREGICWKFDKLTHAINYSQLHVQCIYGYHHWHNCSQLRISIDIVLATYRYIIIDIVLAMYMLL